MNVVEIPGPFSSLVVFFCCCSFFGGGGGWNRIARIPEALSNKKNGEFTPYSVSQVDDPSVFFITLVMVLSILLEHSPDSI